MKTKLMYVALAALLAGSQMTLSAQEQQDKEKKEKKEQKQPPTPEQMIQMQTSQTTRRLMLDDATAKKFTPVYEKFLTELNACREAYRPQDAPDAKPKPAEDKNAQSDDKKAPAGDKKDKAGKNRKAAPAPAPMGFGPEKDLTDAEVADMLKKQFEQERKILDIREKYYAEFSKMLSQKQVLQIYQQERRNADSPRPEFDRRKGQQPGQPKCQPECGQQLE